MIDIENCKRKIEELPNMQTQDVARTLIEISQEYGLSFPIDKLDGLMKKDDFQQWFDTIDAELLEMLDGEEDKEWYDYEFSSHSAEIKKDENGEIYLEDPTNPSQRMEFDFETIESSKQLNQILMAMRSGIVDVMRKQPMREDFLDVFHSAIGKGVHHVFKQMHKEELMTHIQTLGKGSKSEDIMILLDVADFANVSFSMEDLAQLFPNDIESIKSIVDSQTEQAFTQNMIDNQGIDIVRQLAKQVSSSAKLQYKVFSDGTKGFTMDGKTLIKILEIDDLSPEIALKVIQDAMSNSSNQIKDPDSMQLLEMAQQAILTFSQTKSTPSSEFPLDIHALAAFIGPNKEVALNAIDARQATELLLPNRAFNTHSLEEEPEK